MTTTPAMPERFTKKPVTVEAFQMTEARRMDNRDWPEWLNEAWNKEEGQPGALFRQNMDAPLPDLLCIQTLEGVHLVNWGDWIIRGVKGELYPCKPDIFEMTYDRASLQAQPAADWRDRLTVNLMRQGASLTKTQIRALIAYAHDGVEPDPALFAQPAEVLDDKWEGAEEWMPLAWELCAEEHGEEACNELIWTGGPIPEPWGDRWLQYEDEAKRLIALVRKHVPSLRPQSESEQEKELRRSLAEAQATISERNAEIIELQKRIRRSPQAVPMTDEQRALIIGRAADKTVDRSAAALYAICETERLYGITAPAGGEVE